ncbi:MAG: NUDIX domain-containing protein [Patescibacteria group bacterium]
MAHIHELIDWTVGVYIVHKNKVLIRRHEKYNIWIHVGGHIELHEHPVEAAKREVLEEVGLTIKIPNDASVLAKETPPYETDDVVFPLPSPKHMNIHRINETHQHVDLLYYATSETDEVIPENKDDEWVWLTAEEVANHPKLRPWTKEYALGALKELSW